MIQKKVCLLGSYAVGKTSLVRRYVHSIFSDSYLSTLGVTLEKKTMAVDGEDVHLVLWDVAGEEDDFEVPMSYVRGASGYFLVADGTRPETLDSVRDLGARVEATIGPVPRVVLLNKADLTDDWALPDDAVAELGDALGPVFRTSAKSGAHVEDAFETLARAMVTGRSLARPG